jgi:tRNA(Arg) A34 adenosine deaminase TadA
LCDLTQIIKVQNGAKDTAICAFADDRVRFAQYGRNGKEPYDAGTMLLQGLLDEAKASGLSPKELQEKGVTVVTSTQSDSMLSGMLEMVTKGNGELKTYKSGYVYSQERANGVLKRLPARPKAVQFSKDRDVLKRFVCPIPPAGSLDLTSTLTDTHAGYHSVHRVYLMAAYALLNLHDSKDPDGKYVATLMVNKKGTVIAWGLNTNKVNKTLHAEVNMLQSYNRYVGLASGIPAGARIYTTLQCCQMCAGMIASVAENPATLHVYYGMTDPTQKVRQTELGRRHMETLLSGSKGDALRGIKTGASTDLAKTLDADYPTAKWENRGRLDAASYGKMVDYKTVTAALKTKYNKNYAPPEGKTVNPYVLAALEQVRMFLNHVGAVQFAAA